MRVVCKQGCSKGFWALRLDVGCHHCNMTNWAKKHFAFTKRFAKNKCVNIWNRTNNLFWSSLSRGAIVYFTTNQISSLFFNIIHRLHHLSEWKIWSRTVSHFSTRSPLFFFTSFSELFWVALTWRQALTTHHLQFSHLLTDERQDWGRGVLCVCV